ncbi:uncharacterized protein PG998_012537 [Apiospora kogelbergensis]|uniref:uncharacterized protein n=1 Tax=Apiospora kogelbergensis TaxID=1337665 RepID=UPI003131680A
MEGAYDDELPPPASQASSHFPLEPVSGSTLFDVEVARREQLHRRGTLTTGCAEIDGQVLGGHGFERGSVVGISAEHMDTGLLIGLQTVAHSLLANLGTEPHGHAQQPPLRAAVITTLIAPTILPHLRDVIRVQARLKLGGARSRSDEVDAATRQCLGRISVSQVFDIEGLWEVLSELETAAAAVEDTQLVSGPEMDLPASSQQLPPPPSPSLPPPATKLPPLRTRTEVQDSEEEDDVLLSSSPLSSLPSSLVETPEGMEELAQPSPPAAPSPHQPSRPLSPAAPSHQLSPSPPAAPGRQPRPLPIPPPRQPEPTAPGLPDIILITHISNLFSTLFTTRDKTSAHTTLQLLSSHLRYLSRSAGPLILLLNVTSASPTALSGTNPAQPPPPRRPEPEQSSRPLDPTLRSIFNPPPLPIWVTPPRQPMRSAARTSPRSGIPSPNFWIYISSAPKSRGRGKMPRCCSPPLPTVVASSSSNVQSTTRGSSKHWWTNWVSGSGKTLLVPRRVRTARVWGRWTKKWKSIDREQRWGAVEVRNAGCQVVDAFDTTRSTALRPNTEPIRLAAGFGGRRV